MDADWSVEAAADDPVVVVPWQAAPSNGSGVPTPGFVDLRRTKAKGAANDSGAYAGPTPAEVDRLPEAVRHPALRQALLRLNDADGCLRTAKCDVWEIDPDEMESLHGRFDLARAGCGCGSYVDVLLTEPSEAGNLPVQLALHEGWVRRMVRAAADIGELDDARESVSCAEFIVRPACVDGQWGYAVSVYVWSVGGDAPAAEERWAAALTEVASAVVQTVPRQGHDTMCATGE